MNKQQIKELALTNGFKLKEQPDGTLDLNPYVYEFASALLAEAGRVGYFEGYTTGYGDYMTGVHAPVTKSNQYADSIRNAKDGE